MCGKVDVRLSTNAPVSDEFRGRVSSHVQQRDGRRVARGLLHAAVRSTLLDVAQDQRAQRSHQRLATATAPSHTQTVSTTLEETSHHFTELNTRYIYFIEILY